MIVEIDSQDRTIRRFHPLDVVRWLVCDLDVSTLTHIDEIHDAFGRWIHDTLPSVDGRLLVVRVRLVGQTPLHDDLHRDCDQLESSLRAIAIGCGDEQTWLERLRIKTTPPSDDRFSGDLDGPLASLRSVVGRLKSDPEIDRRVSGELSALLSKIPRECRDPDEDPTDARWALELLESASAHLHSHLVHSHLQRKEAQE